MTVNDDFSFVRFLKVVKSLYESSTFTQLGKTVGTALREDEDYEEGDSMANDDDETLGGGSLETVDEVEEKKARAREATVSALSRAFAACYSPSKEEDVTKKDIKNYDPSNDKPSLLEKVVTCTLNHDEGIMSDDDDGTKRTLDDRTYDETFGQSDSLTFDATEDESLPKKRYRGRGRRGKR